MSSAISLGNWDSLCSSLFFLGMGLGPRMKWDGAVEFFVPTIAPKILLFDSSGEEEGLDVLRPSSWLVKSYPPLVLGPFRLSKACFWHFGIWGASSLNSGGSVLPTLDSVMVIQRWGFLQLLWAGKSVRLF